MVWARGVTNWKWGREWNIKCLQKEGMRGELSKVKKILFYIFFLVLIILLSSFLFVSIWCSILSPIFNLYPPCPNHRETDTSILLFVSNDQNTWSLNKLLLLLVFAISSIREAFATFCQESSYNSFHDKKMNWGNTVGLGRMYTE